METRIQKYHEYRESIKNEGELITKIAYDNALVLSYKDRINKINDKILYNIQFESKIVRLASIDNTSKKETGALKNFIEIIDTIKFQTMISEIEELISHFKLQSVLDNSGGISLEWLEQDRNYYEINQKTDLLKKTQADWGTFQIDSINQINKMNNLLDQNNQAYKFNNFDIINPYKEYKGITFKRVYLSIIILISFFIIIAFIMLIVLFCI